MKWLGLSFVTASMSAGLLSVATADGQDTAPLDRFAPFFVIDAAQAPTVDDLLMAPWVDSFATSFDEDGAFGLEIATCSTFFAAREAGLEPADPSLWPVYRGYGLRCLALAQMALLDQASELRAQGTDTAPDAALEGVLTGMFSDLATDGAPAIVTSLANGATGYRIGADDITLDVLASYGTPDFPASHLLVHGENSSVEGTYSDAAVFILNRAAPSDDYTLVLRIDARLDD